MQRNYSNSSSTSKNKKLCKQKALSCCSMSWHRNIHRSSMGKCVVGYLLVMGSEGDMGTHHYDDICRAAASYSVDRHEPSATIPYIYAGLFVGCSYDIFRCYLSHAGYALVFLGDVDRQSKSDCSSSHPSAYDALLSTYYIYTMSGAFVSYARYGVYGVGGMG